jgi:hypothetical protein
VPAWMLIILACSEGTGVSERNKGYDTQSEIGGIRVDKKAGTNDCNTTGFPGGSVLHEALEYMNCR